ncbi:MAG TPA: cyclic nucleotide-gated ion channel [Bradyrhizobium sp.]|uniref:cyclic nucleotide-gated ion channel n=1 Tax=Bradyrhizobium sp. TaxID=376 RepID=UPI002D7F1FF3|nr:cyclic nucleotide-gated ion channel [Bradyrhizobium sp.]HET7884834.1 cyclic nucleotide-gated ion channel [Bradyrhizobium sp.]
MTVLLRVTRMRQRLYTILEQGSGNERFSDAVSAGLIFLVVLTLAATVLESVPEWGAAYSNVFEIIEYLALVVFSIEYAARLWTAVEHPLWHRDGAARAALRFAASPAGLIDLAAVAPFWLMFLVAADFKALLVLRILRFFKLTRYSPAMRSLLDALYSERRALVGCFVILCGATLMAAALMHLAEGAIQPQKFGTIPDAMWWAVVTLGTVGYGDAVPITAVGRLIGGLTIFAGLLMVALPVGIVATAFTNEVHKRDFVVTWGLVARIPLFSQLNATQVADVMKILRAQKVDKGAIIARRGEPAHSMYLIVDGEVEIRLRHRHVRLGAGDFFGEIAALRQTKRSATVQALEPTRLLALDASDLHSLMDREPQIASRIWNAARERLGGELDKTSSDLIAVELPSDVASD